jgi:hypothetical protein
MDTLSEYSVPNAATSAFACNLYHNGFNDIIIGHQTPWGYTNPSITFMKNISYGTFEITDTSKSFPRNPGNIFAVDVNNDGWSDIVSLTANNYSNETLEQYIRIYYNNEGTFNNSNYTDFDLNTRETVDNINYGDINGDGYIDLVYSSNYGLLWGVLYNDGYGGFSAPEVHHVTTYYPSGIAVGDLNNDGRDDIVLCGQLIDVYFSYPSGFQRLQLSADGFSGQVVISDFDQDGYKDILCNSGFGATDLLMYKNNGNNTFQKLGHLFSQSYMGFFVADFNNDGLPDIMFQNNDDSGYFLWYNQGNFQLSNMQFISVPNVGEVSRNFYCADLDNNGFNDIITVRCSFQYYLSANLDIRFNDGNGNFIPEPIVGIQDKANLTSSNLQNYPNPFQDETVFNFSTNEIATVELSVYDLQGKFITRLIKQKLVGGQHSIKWLGIDNDDQSCKPGAYIAYLKVNSKISCAIKVIKI